MVTGETLERQVIMMAILQRKSVSDVWSLNVKINRGEELPTELKDCV